MEKLVKSLDKLTKLILESLRESDTSRHAGTVQWTSMTNLNVHLKIDLWDADLALNSLAMNEAAGTFSFFELLPGKWC